MKLRKHTALAAVVFAAAMNTACGLYGPPPEDHPEPEYLEDAYITPAELRDNTEEAPSEEAESTDTVDEDSHEDM